MSIDVQLDYAMLASLRLAVQVFTEVFSREHQLMKVDPRKSTYLACCLLMRGKMSIADMNRNVMRLKPKLRMVHWNSDGFKLGICSKPPVGEPTLSNDVLQCCSSQLTLPKRYDSCLLMQLWLNFSVHASQS